MLPGQLSMGDLRRLELARTLATGPEGPAPRRSVRRADGGRDRTDIGAAAREKTRWHDLHHRQSRPALARAAGRSGGGGVVRSEHCRGNAGRGARRHWSPGRLSGDAMNRCTEHSSRPSPVPAFEARQSSPEQETGSLPGHFATRGVTTDHGLPRNPRSRSILWSGALPGTASRSTWKPGPSWGSSARTAPASRPCSIRFWA